MTLCNSVKDILWNFEILSMIENHQTLYVEGDKLYIDDRRFQFIIRAFCGDSRNKIVAVIKKSLEMYDEIMTVYKLLYTNSKNNDLNRNNDLNEKIVSNLNQLSEKTESVKNGLSTLATFSRYNKDLSFQISMKNFISEIDKLHKNNEKTLTLYEKHSIA